MDIPATSNQFVNHNPENKFTRIPNELYRVIITSSFPDDAKMLIFLIHRLTAGCQRRAVIIDGVDIYNILGIDRNRLRMMISGLLNLNVIFGGAVKKDSMGRIDTYELSINFDISAWDVSVESSRTTRFNEILKQVLYTTKPTSAVDKST